MLIALPRSLYPRSASFNLLYEPGTVVCSLNLFVGRGFILEVLFCLRVSGESEMIVEAKRPHQRPPVLDSLVSGYPPSALQIYRGYD